MGPMSKEGEENDLRGRHNPAMGEREPAFEFLGWTPVESFESWHACCIYITSELPNRSKLSSHNLLIMNALLSRYLVASNVTF